ncbi:CpaF family protein [Aestuariimicrobium kwangyangense]|uniref:CpaF family protein n=1 Tax=Aestuariimicrobium kwangyangense TaxID=396389 RepID=UPI0003B66CEB|nr:ATPase, T2SS/T4P/T4SS family [Aestuariimicrobium kwangyangense]
MNLAERLAAARGQMPVPPPAATGPLPRVDHNVASSPARSADEPPAPDAGRDEVIVPPQRSSPDEPDDSFWAAPPSRAMTPGGGAQPGSPDADEEVGLGSLAARGGVVPGKQDAMRRLQDRTITSLYERLGNRLSDSELTDEQLRQMVQSELATLIEGESLAMSGPERRRFVEEVQSDILGLGPIQGLLADPSVTEVMVNGPHHVYVEHGGRLYLSGVQFRDEPHLRQIIDRIVGRIGRRIDESSPLVDARLEDGSRVNAIIPPLAVSGSTLTIRKFSHDALSVPDLIRLDTLSPGIADLLAACVRARLNIIISGGTGTGKTTLLNVVSSFIPEGERIISIEDAVELQLQQEHVVRLESRPANIEGKGEIGIRELVRNALRMRPDRIVVGEVRGAEALDMLQAMNTGHDGSLSTVHANTPRDALARLETLVLMAGLDLPLRAIREQIASSIDLIVQLARLRDGTRRVVAVTEVHGMEGQIVTLQDIFMFDYSAGVDPNGRFLGHVQPTGVRPAFAEKFADLGIHLPPQIFGDPMVWSR